MIHFNSELIDSLNTPYIIKQMPFLLLEAEFSKGGIIGLQNIDF